MSSIDPPQTPTHGQSLNRQVVLDEDEYTNALSHIIARDFFPSLIHLDATNTYLDALNSRDPHLINASVRHLEQISNTPFSNRRVSYQTPSQTPYNAGPSDTPSRKSYVEGSRKKPRLDADLSLDSFQAKYTSEDNSSFTQILDEENRKRKEQWVWAWDAQKRVEGQRNKTIEARERMLIEAPPLTGVREKFTIEVPLSAGLLTDGREPEEDLEPPSPEGVGGAEDSCTDKEITLLNGKNQETVSQTDVMARTKDKRSAGVDGWKFRARNSLMFPPDADESPYHPTLSYNIKDGGDPKSIQYGSTRLSEQDHSSSSFHGDTAPPSPTRSRINAAITGTPYRPKGSTEDFSLVPNLPSPTAAELGPAAVKQLMTWGTLNATPRVISSMDTTDLPLSTTPFHLPAISPREVISQRLSNSASKSLRTKAGLLGLGSNLGRTPGLGISKTPNGSMSITGKRGNMAPPTWTPRRSEATGNLTPAARRLLERSTMGTAARRTEAAEKSGGWDKNTKEQGSQHTRWTPTPSHVKHR
ncbi:nuclear protein DGCR14 [Collybia nuda]|uniref:Nuclear protein DGCR14 n=1 Tax=Collybia nuda TaxID=64659 RepID=A0A9P5Y3Z9_9AGAR|nr:nuclear protein DGCR14 [Collybia nuda]